MIEMKEPCFGRNFPKMTTRKNAEALRAGITQAQSTPILSPKGIVVRSILQSENPGNQRLGLLHLSIYDLFP